VEAAAPSYFLCCLAGWPAASVGLSDYGKRAKEFETTLVIHRLIPAWLSNNDAEGWKMIAAPRTLKNLYTLEMRDLWSANDQMEKIMQTFSEKATDPKLKRLFERSASHIAEHTQALREMMGAGSASPCVGMQGLIQEATQHGLESDLSPHLRDLELIAQYQRMSHYGLAGFGTVAAYADALGMTEQANKLRSIVSDIYKGDEYSTTLAETLRRADVQV
jgi:ferritin-like metal-binding protein YciE